MSDVITRDDAVMRALRYWESEVAKVIDLVLQNEEYFQPQLRESCVDAAVRKLKEGMQADGKI